MEQAVLTEQQSACRAAHKQVQLVHDLYEYWMNKTEVPERDRAATLRRQASLRETRVALLRQLKEQGLLPSRPDPEKEGLMELIAGLKDALGTAEHSAAREQIVLEETELLRLLEELQAHAGNSSIRQATEETRAAIARLGRDDATGTG